MPFKSEAQRRFMHAKHPGIADRWEKEAGHGKPTKHKKAVKKQPKNPYSDRD